MTDANNPPPESRPEAVRLSPHLASLKIPPKPSRLWVEITHFWAYLQAVWRYPRLGKLIICTFVLVVTGGTALTAAAITYIWIAAQLPSAQELRSRSYQFATTQILDREGNLLWEIIDPTGGRRTDVSLQKVSPDLIRATLATEDRFFYLNVGVDPIAITRAVYNNVTEGQIVSGASTITQQLARNVFLSPEERTQTSFSRKVKEAVLAMEINRRYTKNQILEIYLNQIYYGNLAYGIEAAAQTYFGKPAAELTLPEAAMLAGLPQSPAIHDPYVNYEGAKVRQAVVLELMVEAQYLTRDEAEAAKVAPLAFRDASFPVEVPHFISFVRQELERNIPPAYIYQAGLRVMTSLDPQLQALAEQELQAQIEALSGRNVTNGALVALDVESGHILAMVGSKDFWDEPSDGQVNMALSPRQPASTIKPLTYLAAFEQLDWTPSTLLMDVPVSYPDTDNKIYRPTNVDLQFHGPVSIRTALANSYNIPAIKALEAVGIDSLKAMATRLGITTLTRDDYGLSLALGSGEVSLLEMTGAYQAMANGGVLRQPTAILQITDNFGRIIEPVRPLPRSILRPEHAYLITHILADYEARTSSFDPDRVLQLSRPAAVKTGTSNDFRDNWAIGYTPDLVTGVWLGNADYSPMRDVGGVIGAAPVWRRFMEQAHANQAVQVFTRPPAIVEMEVCADSGTLPSPVCPARRMEIFFSEQPPFGPEHDLHRLIEIDMNTGLLANELCRANVAQIYYRAFPPEGREWALQHEIEQPPIRYCPSTDIVAAFTRPVDNVGVRGVLFIQGSAFAGDFSHYQLEIGEGTAPERFTIIQHPIDKWVANGLLATLDTTQLANGSHTLRLVVFDETGGAKEARVRIFVDNAPEVIALQTPVTTPPYTITPPVTLTPTITATLSLTFTPEITGAQVLTLSLTPTPTGTLPIPTLTPAPLSAELPFQIFTATLGPPTATPIPLSIDLPVYLLTASLTIPPQLPAATAVTE